MMTKKQKMHISIFTCLQMDNRQFDMDIITCRFCLFYTSDASFIYKNYENKINILQNWLSPHQKWGYIDPCTFWDTLSFFSFHIPLRKGQKKKKKKTIKCAADNKYLTISPFSTAIHQFSILPSI